MQTARLTPSVPRVYVRQSTLRSEGSSTRRKFLAAASLTLDYKVCTAPPAAPFRGAYIDAKKTLLEWKPSKDDKLGKQLLVSINHFSGYIIAY